MSALTVDALAGIPRSGGAPVLSVTNVSKTFPGQQALRDVSIELPSGQITALVGHNGSGKSTLIKVSPGFHTADAGGAAAFHGEDVDLYNATASWRKHVHAIHQDLGLIPSLSVLDNLAIEGGFATRLGRINWRAQRAAVRCTLDGFDLDASPDAILGGLPRHDQAIIAIARAVSGIRDDASSLLILDEPTATLAKREVDLLFRAVRRVAERGCAVLFVSHRLEDVLEIADHVTVLRNGVKVADQPLEGVGRADLVELIVGKRLATAEHAPAPIADAAPYLSVTDLHTEQLRGVSIDVAPGEIVGVAGLDGSGREDVTRVVAGILGPAEGSITVGGLEREPGGIARAMDAGVGLVPGDRAGEGLVPDFTVAENISLGDLRPVTKAGRLSHRAELKSCLEWIRQFDIRPDNPAAKIGHLSGGNAQKVVLAKWRRRSPKVLLMEEPTAGVDIGAKGMIWDSVRDVATGGTSVLVTSSDWEELVENCSRVIVITEGCVAGVLYGSRLTIDEIAHLSLTELHEVNKPND